MKLKTVTEVIIWSMIWSPIILIFFGGNFAVGLLFGGGNNTKAFIISMIVWLINNSVRKMLLNNGYGLEYKYNGEE